MFINIMTQKFSATSHPEFIFQDALPERAGRDQHLAQLLSTRSAKCNLGMLLFFTST